MTRTIKFYKDEKDYIFEEEKNNKKVKISIKDKILDGAELYGEFFEEYDIKNPFVMIDETTAEDKKNDKMCGAIYEEVKGLFENIEKTLKNDLNIEGNEKG